ncbi:MAG: hypothetical protein IPL32_16315 [Chloracidobacterium sp.]|nr:hypothetical protein [Chloracidobacterium sp.]
MINGPARFKLYLNQLETMLLEAVKQPDAALYLYQNGARTTLFMLEGLAKLYGNLHNKKRFKKMEDNFKLLEDGLGALDHYDNFAKEFAADKKVPAAITKFAQEKAHEKAASLNKVLIDKNWIGKNADRLSKIQKKLRDADWLEDKAEMKTIESFYQRSIEKITAFAKTYDTGFTELETQVHELRRKLRWLSIYPQTLQGSIQLTNTSSKDKNVKKYLTPEIVNSPFNKMPAVGTNRYVLTFNRDYFLALSWMISELGKLKDEGLRFFVLNEAGAKAGAADEAVILSKASDISRTFFSENNLGKMIVGVNKV